MEVKIKIGDEMIDAKIVMMNGDMIVSPKVVKFEPKDGDILSSFFRDEYQGTFVFEEAGECGEAIFYFALDADGKFITGNGCNYFGYIYNLCPATEEEKKLLFDKLAEEGYSWDAERKKLVKIKWKPKAEEHYFKPKLDMGQFILHQTRWLNDVTDRTYYKKGWIFKEQIDCENFCLKLNEAISQVKP